MLRFFIIVYLTLSLLAILLYLPKLIGFFYAFKKPRHPRARTKRRISVIVPARGESKIIGDLLASIEKQDYDRAFFDVNVIVKDENDATIGIATDMGARVYLAREQTCKGDALDGYFKALAKEELKRYDAFVIVDADAVLSPSYLRELNNALEENYDIYITRKHAKNYLGGKKNRSVFSNCATLTWPILDDLSNNFRMRHEMPLNLCGQGMMLRRAVIEELGGWPYRTLTEDYELKLDSLLKGYRSMFYPYAALYTEEALGREENCIRRLRWLTGYKQCDKKYRDQIKAQVRARGRCNATAAITMLAGIALAIGNLIAGKVLRAAASFCFLTAIPFLIMYTLLFLYSALAMLACRETFAVLSRTEKLFTLLYNPFFLLEYIPLYFKSVRAVHRGQPPKWKETERIEYDAPQ